jgi:preprotein translocase subunit SecE
METEKKGLANYLSDTKAELKKVTWPGKDMLVKSTILILFIVAFYTVYISVLDVAFGSIFRLLKV